MERNAFTDIERPLVMTLAERVRWRSEAHGRSIIQLDPHIESWRPAQFVQIAPPSDIVITVLMEGARAIGATP